MSIQITLYTDPACPFAFSAEPVRQRLRWFYGDGLTWWPRMIVLTREPRELELLAEGASGLQRRYGMPIAPGPYARQFSCEPACLAVVAARRHDPGRAQRLLRALRVRAMAGGLLDDPPLIAAAADDAGIAAAELAEWAREREAQDELEADAQAARSPSPAARALDHKLGGPPDARRYSAPSYVLRRGDDGTEVVIPGFNPAEAYEVAIANLAPDLPRGAVPETVGELLAWAGEPLATAEVTAIMPGSEPEVRAQLARAATPVPAGADLYWSL